MGGGFLAGKCFVRYRRRRDTRRSPLPDFYIGAHEVVMHKVERVKHARGLTGGACAIVTERDALRSKAQVVATCLTSHFQHVHVCRGVGEAEDWLAAHR